MKERLKGFIIGTVATSILSMGMSAFADPVSKQINAVYNDIKIYVNGVKVTPKDSDGNIVEPFISDGTTYLPIRAVGSALGMPIEWDSKTSSVYLGSKPTASTTGLTQIKYARLTGSDWNFDQWTDRSNTPFSLAGQIYSSGIGFDYAYTPEPYIIYNLDSQYKHLTGLFGADDLDKDNGKSYTTMVIYGDDKEIYRSSKKYPGDKPENVDVDVTGVNQIKILFPNSGGINYTAFVNPQLR